MDKSIHVINYCKLCLQPDTRPNTLFSKDGICPSCEYHNSLNVTDWDERLSTLLNVVEKYRDKSSQYDCIVGVSGGKDSLRQALWVREKLGLRPLLVSLVYPPFQSNQIGVDNLSNLIELGFDLLQISPGPETWRKLMLKGFKEYGNWSRSTEMALFSACPRIAIDYKIPLILWGDNPALQVGDLGALGVNGYDGNNLANINTLNSGNIDWMVDQNISQNNLLPYKFPTSEDFSRHNIQIIYIGWALGDWSLKNNAFIAVMSGLKVRKDVAKNTGDLFGYYALDEDFVSLNQMMKYYKYGFGRATEYVNEMIRNSEISRDQGIEIVMKYDGKCSGTYIQNFCDYLDITLSDFWEKVHSITNKELFSLEGNSIKPKFNVGTGIK